MSPVQSLYERAVKGRDYMKPMVYSIYNTATSQKGESMSDEDVTAKIDEAVRLIRDYIDAQVVVIGDAHKFWGYNKGRVDAYRDVSNLCDRLLRTTVGHEQGKEL